MTSLKKAKRNKEKFILKKRIDELLQLLEMSRSEWKKLKYRVVGTGLDVRVAHTRFKTGDTSVKWGRHLEGKKPSLKNQYSVLWDLWKTRIENEKLLEELKASIDKKKQEGEIT